MMSDHDCSDQEKRNILASVKEIEKNLKLREKQGACYVLNITDRNGGLFPLSCKYMELTRGRIAPGEALQFIVEVTNISELGPNSRCGSIVFSGQVRSLPINDLDGMQERCMHCRILEGLFANSEFCEFWQFLDTQGRAGCYSDNADDPYKLYRKLDSLNKLTVEDIRSCLKFMNQSKLIRDVVDKYTAVALQSCDVMPQQKPGGSSDTTKDDCHGHVPSDKPNPIQPNNFKTDSVTGNNVIIIHGGTANFGAPLIDNGATGTPSLVTPSSVTPKREFSVPEQESLEEEEEEEEEENNYNDHRYTYESMQSGRSI